MFELANAEKTKPLKQILEPDLGILLLTESSCRSNPIINLATSRQFLSKAPRLSIFVHGTE